MAQSKIILLNQAYPNPSLKDFGNPFVHDRAKMLINHFDLVVAKVGTKETDYEYESVKVKCFPSLVEFDQYVKANMPDLFLIHFCEPWMFTHAILKYDRPGLIFVHGSEAHAWYRILFILHRNNIKAFGRFIINNLFTVRNFRRMIKYSNATGRIEFAFVSEWMRRITETDTFTKVKNYSVIHNAIDNHLFTFQLKNTEHRKKILILRSFNSKKYANDISMAAIAELSKKPFFKELEFHIYGQGMWWEKETGKIKQFKNVILHNQFLNHHQIKELHKDFGIFLCPTRMDAQGVSMCEAMSSGLVPVTSLSTAIPEFVKEGYSGFLTTGPGQIAKKIEWLYNNPEKFREMSRNAAKSIVEISGVDKVVREEKELIEKCIERTKK